MRIRGYWHVYMISHWYTVISEQMRILLTSGLYDETEEISVGLIGFHEDRALFQRLFANLYPKIKIRYYSNNPTDYEFPTLKLIEQDDSDYIGYYFHTKAVSRPFEPLINHWRSLLNEKVLNQWEEHRQRVENEYEVSSINYLKSPNHFSGNFWWFNRSYINKLPKIDSLDKDNRFMAEQWICLGNPKFYSPRHVEPGNATFLMQYKHEPAQNH